MEFRNRSKFSKVLIVLFIIGLGLAVTAFGFGFVLYTTSSLDIEKLTSYATPLQIYDSENEALSTASQSSEWISLDEINDFTVNAFVAVEDRKFYEHRGINIGRMFVAMFNNITNGKIVEGASTISQQLIKNTHLSNEKTIIRKAKEIALALKLESVYSKDEIMQMYLSAIYFGNGCYGIESASNFYFGKSASEINLNQSAILAGIIKSPAYYSPINNATNCEERKNLVLSQMFELGYINKEQYQESRVKSLELNLGKGESENELVYVYCATDEAKDILGISTSQIAQNGYKIYTYCEPKHQEELVDSFGESNAENLLKNAILVDNETGGIQAFFSSYKFGGNTMTRSPASTIKPVLVYAPALEYNEIYPTTFIEDEPTTFVGDYSPRNISDKYYGKITASECLARSLNVPAVKMLDELGIEKCKNFAQKCGITFSSDDNGLAIALGALTNGLTIQQLVDAYSAFANLGKETKSTFIKKIEDRDGKIIYMHHPISSVVMRDDTAYLVGQMMKDCVEYGTCQALSNFDYEVHAKSGTNGTSNDNYNTDALCVAQTSEHTACIWYFAKDSNEKNLLRNSSVSQQSPTKNMAKFFARLYDESPERFARPSSVVDIELDALSFEEGDNYVAISDSAPRYKITKTFSANHYPTETNKKWTDIEVATLSKDEKNGGVWLCFDAQEYQIYELVREEKIAGNEVDISILNSTKNTDGEVKFLDTNISKDKSYKYYVRCYNNVSSKKVVSNSVQVDLVNKHTKSKSNVEEVNINKKNWWY